MGQWKRHLLDGDTQIFTNDVARRKREQDALELDLYEQIGRLRMELEWLKKSCPLRLRSNGA